MSSRVTFSSPFSKASVSAASLSARRVPRFLRSRRPSDGSSVITPLYRLLPDRQYCPVGIFGWAFPGPARDAVWDHRRMTPEDDPEARIRALERPLGERATELGTGPYNRYPPPPTYPMPGWSGGTPFPPPRPPGHNRLWLILAVIAVGLIALAGGVAVYSVSNVTSGRPISSAPSREAGAGGGRFDT